VEIRVQILDEASKPAEHISKALSQIDAETKKLITTMKPLDALLASLAKSFRGLDTVLGASTKQLLSFDKQGEKTIANLRHIEEAAKKAGGALRGLHHGGGEHGGEHGGKMEGLAGGMSGGMLGGFFATGPLGILLGTAKELGEAFEGLINKVYEETALRDQQVSDLASRGIVDPEAYRALLGSKAEQIGVTRAAMLGVANILGLAPFKKGVSEAERERTIATRSEEILKLAGGKAPRAEEIANLLGRLAEGAKPRPGAALALGAEFKGPATLANVEAFLDKQLSKTLPPDIGRQADRAKEGFAELFEAPPNAAVIKALEDLNALLRKPEVVQAFANAITATEKAAIAATSALIKFATLISPSPKSPAEKTAANIGTGGALIGGAGLALGLAATGVGLPLAVAIAGALAVGVKAASSIQSKAAFAPEEPPGHAEGGVTMRGHVARVGEGGPEVILPLSKAASVLSDAMGGAVKQRGVTIHPGAVAIHVTQQPGENAEQLSRRVADLVPIILSSALEQMCIEATGGIA